MSIYYRLKGLGYLANVGPPPFLGPRLDGGVVAAGPLRTPAGRDMVNRAHVLEVGVCSAEYGLTKVVDAMARVHGVDASADLLDVGIRGGGRAVEDRHLLKCGIVSYAQAMLCWKSVMPL